MKTKEQLQNTNENLVCRDIVENMSLDELLEQKQSIKSKEELQKMPFDEALRYLSKNHWAYDMGSIAGAENTTRLYYVAQVVVYWTLNFGDGRETLIVGSNRTGRCIALSPTDKGYKEASLLFHDLENRYFERDFGFTKALPYEAIIKNKKKMFPKSLLLVLYLADKKEAGEKKKAEAEKKLEEENKKKEIAKNTAMEQVYFNKYMTHMVR